METKFFVLTDRVSTNPALNSNGGDYDFGRTVAVRDGQPIGVRHWTSADFDYCPLCGQFEENCECSSKALPSEWEGWEAGEVMTDPDSIEIAMWRLENGQFALAENAR